VIDVGVVAPTDSEGFFEECGFGEDSEGSVVMGLRPGAAAALLDGRDRGGGSGDGGKRGGRQQRR
jgi:hypothetical protein